MGCYSIITFFSNVPSSNKYIIGKFITSFISLPFKSILDNIFLKEEILYSISLDDEPLYEIQSDGISWCPDCGPKLPLPSAIP